MRRKLKKKAIIRPDIKYKSEVVSKFTNYIMWSGKKETATRIVYDMLEAIKDMAKTENPLEVFETALKNTAPQVEVRSRRVGGANYQVPREVAKKGKAIHLKLADEIIAASKNEGEAVRKKENTHKMAEANKAFAHFAW